MPLKLWIVFVFVSILPAISPGPAVLLAVSNSIRFGPSATVYSALANSIGLTLMGIAVVFGLSALISASTVAFAAVKIAGAIYLCYLGVKLWRRAEAFDLTASATPASKRPAKLFVEALVLALTNPKSFVLVAALLPPFIDRDLPVFPQAAILSLTFAAMCFLNHLLLAFAAERLRGVLVSKSRMSAVRRALGTLFIGFGAALALNAR
jgi:homoserine/homoserine lactone efflux protein